MRGRLAGRRALVTGGASGIGAACCSLMAAEGAEVVVVDLPESRAAGEAVCARIVDEGGTASFVAADVRRPGAVAEIVADGAADAVVTSAGVSHHPDQSHLGDLLDLSVEAWRFVLDVNLTGTFLTCVEAAKAMIDAGRPGTIVTVASVAARIPTAGVYSVSKAAVAMLTRSLALQVAPFGIRVNSVGPGYVATAMLEGVAQVRGSKGAEGWLGIWEERVPLGRLGTPEDVARVVLFLSSEESDYLTGSVLYPDGGYLLRGGTR